MSRAKHQESLNAVQLFPFVAVLLCTMGSLLVLLVGVARSSKVRAGEQAAIQQAAAKAAAVVRNTESKESAATARLELEKIAKYQTELDTVHTKAADQLRQDQLRLSHFEDHMRRLREQLDSLKIAAKELNSLEGEHYDDRKQAQSEIERLEQLIEESRNNIEQLRAEAKARAKSYAIVPYQGHRGTFRRPVYIECRANDVVFQPEGVMFTAEDFQPPIGPGNPLVAALRAAHEHIVRYETGSPAGKEAEPYPLIIVRPKGVRFYYYVREAIQSWDSEFGYELVEEDWQLKYAPADPQLATVEQQAAELSRGRLRALAAAAPQAYGAYRGASGGGGPYGGFGGFAGGGGGGGYGGGLGGDDDDAGESGGGGGEGPDYEVASAPAAGGGGPQFPTKAARGHGVVVADRNQIDGHADGAAEGQKDGDATDDRYASKKSSGASGTAGKPGTSGTSTASGQPDSLGTSGSAGMSGPPGKPGVADSAASPQTGGQPRKPGLYRQHPPDELERKSDGSPANGSYTAGDDPEEQLDEMARASAASDKDDAAAKHNRTKPRGKNWAIRNANPGTIPIRRTIQVVVRDDALSILPETSATNEAAAAGREFKFGDSPQVAYEDLIVAVDKRIDNWGMAGQGLYWRPVVELKISGDGDRRVDDLMRLLKHSGVEVRGTSIAQHDEGGSGSANR